MEKTIAPGRWFRLIPVAFITYSLAYLDRANFNLGSEGGMLQELNINDTENSLLKSLFFLGYFFFQIPGVDYAAKKSTKKLIFWSLILWGACAATTGLLHDIWPLRIIRFMLGVVESAVFPAMLLLMSRWFTRPERSRANTFLIFGNPVTLLWMSIVSGYLINAAGWRGMFIFEGVPAIIWAFFWWWLIDDKPKDAKWLTQEEKESLDKVMQEEQKTIRPVRFWQAATSRTVIVLSLQYAFWSIGVYGLVMWLPTMIKGASNMNIVETGWLSSAPYLAAIIAMIISSYFSDKTLKRKIFVWPFLLIAGLAFLCGSFLNTNQHFWLSFVLLCIAGLSMYAPYGPFFAIMPEIFPANVVGGAMAVINSMGALGSFLGVLFVGYLKGSTGGFRASFLFLAISLILAAILTVLGLLSYKDSRKHQQAQQPVPASKVIV